MSNVGAITEQLGLLSDGYEVSDATKHILGQRELVPIIGPFAVGKTALMGAAEQLDHDFGRVRSFTTRQRREGEGDGAYEFLPHEAHVLQAIKDRAVACELVQFVVHPTTGNVYGSTVDSYDSTYSMLDTMPSSLPALVLLPFRGIKKVAVAAPPEVWRGRMAGRLRDGKPDDIRKRVAEGISNISWSLDQGDDLGWVINDDRSIESVATDLIRVVKDGSEVATEARNAAYDLLQEMIAIRSE